MVKKKELLGNELMKEIVAIRIDTMWNMLALRKGGGLPPIDAEKATGDLDDKGALFLPGGLVLQDWEGMPIEVEPFRDRKARTFRRTVREAMRGDGAHLIRRLIYTADLGCAYNTFGYPHLLSRIQIDNENIFGGLYNLNFRQCPLSGAGMLYLYFIANSIL